MGAGGVIECRGLCEFGEGWLGGAGVFVLVVVKDGCFFIVNISIGLAKGWHA